MMSALYVPTPISTPTSILPNVGTGLPPTPLSRGIACILRCRGLNFCIFSYRGQRNIVIEAPVSISAKVVMPSTATEISQQTDCWSLRSFGTPETDAKVQVRHLDGPERTPRPRFLMGGVYRGRRSLYSFCLFVFVRRLSGQPSCHQSLPGKNHSFQMYDLGHSQRSVRRDYRVTYRGRNKAEAHSSQQATWLKMLVAHEIFR